MPPYCCRYDTISSLSRIPSATPFTASHSPAASAGAIAMNESRRNWTAVEKAWMRPTPRVSAIFFMSSLVMWSIDTRSSASLALMLSTAPSTPKASMRRPPRATKTASALLFTRPSLLSSRSHIWLTLAMVASVSLIWRLSPSKVSLLVCSIFLKARMVRISNPALVASSGLSAKRDARVLIRSTRLIPGLRMNENCCASSRENPRACSCLSLLPEMLVATRNRLRTATDAFSAPPRLLRRSPTTANTSDRSAPKTPAAEPASFIASKSSLPLSAVATSAPESLSAVSVALAAGMSNCCITWARASPAVERSVSPRVARMLAASVILTMSSGL